MSFKRHYDGNDTREAADKDSLAIPVNRAIPIRLLCSRA